MRTNTLACVPHSPPVRIVQVEVILVHPTLLVLQMWAIVVPATNRDRDAGRFPCFQDCHHLVGFGVLEVGLHELVPPTVVTVAVGRFENRSAPFLGSVLEPKLKMI